MSEMVDLPKFRSGNTLTTRFTGTLTERYGEPLEHVPTPMRLVQWFQVNGLPVTTCTPSQLDGARALRENLHAALTAVARKEPIPGEALTAINQASSRGQAVATLTSAGNRAWGVRPEAELDDALGIIARDAIELLSGEAGGRLCTCAFPTCRAVFVDTSRGHTRRWCDMNTCGNREKKARYRSLK